MLHWIHRRRDSAARNRIETLDREVAARDRAEALDREIAACATALARELPAIASRYSGPVVAIGLAMHLKASLAACRREGHLTEAQTKRLIDLLLRAEDESGSAPPTEPAPDANFRQDEALTPEHS